MSASNKALQWVVSALGGASPELGRYAAKRPYLGSHA